MKSHDIEIENLNFSYLSSAPLFINLGLRVEKGEKVLIHGANGRGKTTLLRLLSGLVQSPPKCGQVLDVPLEVIWSKRAKIGWAVSNDSGFFSRVSGYDNLDFFNALKGGDKRDLQRIVEEWQPLEPFLKCLQQPYYLCSTGMKHLLAIARAFVCSAEIVLLDEPMRSLDESIANFLWEWISRQRITVIIASHQKSSCGERYTCYCLDKGKLWPY